MALLPPPETTYDTLEEARKAINEHARAQGYALTIKRTKKVGNRKDGAIKRLILRFSQGNKYKPVAVNEVPETRTIKRIRASRSTGCRFKAVIQRIDERWHVTVIRGNHNHDAFDDSSAHPNGRALNEEARERVLLLTSAGVKPGTIVASLRNESSINVTAHYIYNIRNSDRALELQGRTPLQSLLDRLVTSGVKYYTAREEDGQKLSHLFVVSSSAKEICSRYTAGVVWLMDSTYKNNRDRLPLLRIELPASTIPLLWHTALRKKNESQTTTGAMQKLQQEFCEMGIIPKIFIADRELALTGAINIVFPDLNGLLCRWHLSKSILAKHKKFFTSIDDWEAFFKNWNILVSQDRIETFKDNRKSMRESWGTSHLQVVRYIDEA